MNAKLDPAERVAAGIIDARLAHVCIETTDLAATEAFYAILGLKRRFDFRNLQGELVAFYLAFTNNSYIEVIKTLPAKPAGNIAHFAIEVGDINEAQRQLRDSGVEVSEKKLGIDMTWMITCYDPNGIFIECHQYTPESMQHVGGWCEVDYRPGD